MFKPRNSKRRFCTAECVYETRKVQPKKAAGNRYVVHHRGRPYVRVVLPDGSQVAEHRYVFEQHYGVKLQPWHHVDHKDGDGMNNNIDNLTLRNKFAMEQVLKGKSITDVGRTKCSKGHKKDGVRVYRTGHLAGRQYTYCKQCENERNKQYRSGTTNPPD